MRSTVNGADGPGMLDGGAGAVPSRTEAVLGALRRAVLAGELRPGQPLVETELAQRLGVSKTPVREALKTLAGTGLVSMSPYRGAAVRVVDGAGAAAIYDLRLLLEPEAVRRAVSGAASGAVSGGGDWVLARLALQRSDAAAGHAERSLHNRDFHRALYLGCGNPLLVRALDDLADQTALVSAQGWQQDQTRGGDQTWQREAAEHRAVLAAAAAGDGDGAAALVRGHIERLAARHFHPQPVADGKHSEYSNRSKHSEEHR